MVLSHCPANPLFADKSQPIWAILTFSVGRKVLRNRFIRQTLTKHIMGEDKAAGASGQEEEASGVSTIIFFVASSATQ
jgi:hypothetical protein